MVALVMATFDALMTFQPSRSLAVSIRRPSEVMALHELVRIAKCPPRRNRTPLSVGVNSTAFAS